MSRHNCDAMSLYFASPSTCQSPLTGHYEAAELLLGAGLDPSFKACVNAQVVVIESIQCQSIDLLLLRALITSDVHAGQLRANVHAYGCGQRQSQTAATADDKGL